MAEGQVDPTRLQGAELTRWYVRSPTDIERERQATAQQHYREYFGEPNAAGSTKDLTELRRKQAEFEKVRREISKRNSWLAAPALAPAVVIAGLEGASALVGNASLNGRTPSPAEVMAMKMKIERMVEPYIRRGGVSRSNKPPGQGGLR
jgi:hypothetical protein